ncbi:alpha/beta hydrolase [Candidatus Woesebacteria bacterium]|nr:MAG: alpha/beta hydrolase [Candidatus Woesebacteria bacterium]
MASKNIILLHGWGASSKKLKPLEKELVHLGWKVVIPKLAGFEKPVTSVWDLDRYSTYVTKIAVKHFDNDKYIVFGHSFGGRIAVKMGLRSNRVSGLVLCASGGFSRASKVKRMVFFIAAKAGKIFLVIPIFSKMFRKGLYKVAREHDYEKLGFTMKKTFQNVINEDLRKVIHKVKVPILILWGLEDKMTPIGDARFIKRNSAYSQMFIYKNQGHKLPYNLSKSIACKIDNYFK